MSPGEIKGGIWRRDLARKGGADEGSGRRIKIPQNKARDIIEGESCLFERHANAVYRQALCCVHPMNLLTLQAGIVDFQEN